MTTIRRLLKDRKAAQRGSVLSGVLFMTAFIAIIAGALMTELSTNFLLSHNLMIRMSNQATVNSAVESSLSQLQATSLNSGCPSLAAVNLNNSWSQTTYTSCWPTVREQPNYKRLLGSPSAAFSIDGTHSVISRTGQSYEIYLVGNSAGKLYEFDFGSSARLSFQFPGSVSGPPVALADMAACCVDEISTLVPLSIPVPSDRPSGCDSGYCVAYLAQDGLYPDGQCYLPAKGLVTSAPAAGVNNPTVYFFGDQTGSLFAYTATDPGSCAFKASWSSPGSQPIVAGPVVFRNPYASWIDEIYVVTSDSSTTALVRYEYVNGKKGPTLNRMASQSVPAAKAVGLAVDMAALPARAAITFGGGTVAVVTMQADLGMSAPLTTSLWDGIADAPSWCCGASPTLIGVAQTNALFVLDPNQNLKVVASYPVGTTISGSPAADAGGDWFFGGDDGNVYEVPAIASSPTIVSFGSNLLGQVSSSVTLGSCPSGLCVYLGSQNGNLYLVPLDARDIVITACITTSASSPCSGATPRLTAKVEVGAAGNPNAVHIQAWSYSS